MDGAVINPQPEQQTGQPKDEANNQRFIQAQELREAEFAGGFGGPPPSGGGYGRGGSGGGYETDLFGMAKQGATMQSHEPHPDFPGATAGHIHADPSTQLFPRDHGSHLNAQYAQANPSHDISPYHQERPIVSYSTNAASEGMVRLFGDNPVGEWATRSVDVFYGLISGSSAKSALSLKNEPSMIEDVRLPLGTTVQASRPVSDAARQYNFSGADPSWFTNHRKLG